MALKLKASDVLSRALNLIQTGQQRYACCAIQDVETQVRWDTGEQNVSSKAMNVFSTFMQTTVKPEYKSLGEWWPVGSPDRLAALEKAILLAIKRGD